MGQRANDFGRRTIALDGSKEKEGAPSFRVPFLPKRKEAAGTGPGLGPAGPKLDLVPLILRNKENKVRFSMEAVERSIRDVAEDQQIADAKVYIGQDSRQEGPFHIKVSEELATELKEAGTIDIFEMRGKEEEHSQVEFEVCRADEQGRNLTLLEELQTREARGKALAQERKEAREKERESRAPSTLATVVWPPELLGWQEDPGTISTVVEQIRTAMQMCQKGPEEQLLFSFNVVPTTKSMLGTPEAKSLVYIDFPGGDASKANEIIWPRAIEMPGVKIPLKLAFKREFTREHGLKACCNQVACKSTTGSGVCKVHYAFKAPEFDGLKTGLSNFDSRRFEQEAAKLERKRKRKEQVDQRSALFSAAKAILAPKKECRWHLGGRCKQVLGGCKYDHKGVDPAEIDCASARVQCRLLYRVGGRLLHRGTGGWGRRKRSLCHSKIAGRIRRRGWASDWSPARLHEEGS